MDVANDIENQGLWDDLLARANAEEVEETDADSNGFSSEGEEWFPAGILSNRVRTAETVLLDPLPLAEEITEPDGGLTDYFADAESSRGSRGAEVTKSNSAPSKKQESASKQWVFTVHLKDENPHSRDSRDSRGFPEFEERADLTAIQAEIARLKTLHDLCDRFVCQLERSPAGQAHFQGACVLTKPKRMTALCKVVPGGFFQKMRGAWEDQRYCLKDGLGGAIMYDNIPLWRLTKGSFAAPLVKLDRDGLRPEQREWFDLFEPPCIDERTVWWLFEREGGWGKSHLTKTLYDVLGPDRVMVCSGKYSDICQNLSVKRETHGRYPDVVVVDVPRVSTETGHVFISYPAIEKLKDGLLYAPKYEGGEHRFRSPHVVVLANVPPHDPLKKFSADRWKIFELHRGQDATRLEPDACPRDEVAVVDSFTPPTSRRRREAPGAPKRDGLWMSLADQDERRKRFGTLSAVDAAREGLITQYEGFGQSPV